MPIERVRNMFATRLQTLDALLSRAEAQWHDNGRDPETLLSARLAADMLPLAHQVAYACEQPRQFALFCTDDEAETLDPTGWRLSDAHQTVHRSVDALHALDGDDDAPLERYKHLTLGGGLTLQLSGQDYVQDWLTPNFYFHMVTAYDILRHLGVTIGKADYMAHLRARIQGERA